MTISCCIKLFFYLTIVFLVIGCQVKQEKEISLGYDEFYFDEVLASLSEDENGDLWIGSETGDIFWFADNKIKKCFNLQVERIYKVLPMVFTPGDTSFLVGVRNSGLQYWRFRRDSFPTTKQFYIPHKNEEYSPYDFVKFGDILYVATSNGFYRVSLSDKNDEMELVFPTKEELYNEHNKGDYAIRNLVLQKDGTILGSSPRGIFYYNPERETRDSILLKIDNVEHVSIYRDTIFALANNAIYRYKDGNTISLPCKNMPQAYFEDSNDNKWLIASQSIRIGRNRLDEDFKEINLPRSIPLKGGRNVIVRSKLGHFSYLITRNALWRVPTHLNIYDHLKTVKAVSKDSSGILYFVTSTNELYKKSRNGKAEFVKKIKANGHIQWIEVVCGQLYFHTGSKMIYKTTISDYFFLPNTSQPLFSFEDNSNDIGSVYIHAFENEIDGLFFGTKSGLFCVKPDLNMNRVISIPLNGKLQNHYVTSIKHGENHGNCDYIAVGTLNHGLYGALGMDHSLFKRITSEKSLVDAIPLNFDDYIVLTNQKIEVRRGGENYSISAKGFSKLLYMNDSTFYAIADRGINKYRICKDSIYLEESFLSDIVFEPNGCLKLSDSLLLISSSLGSCILNDRRTEVNIDQIEFVKRITDNDGVWYLIVIFLLLLIGYIVYRYRIDKRKVIQETEEKVVKDEKVKLLEELHDKIERYIEELNVQRHELKNASALIDTTKLVEQCESHFDIDDKSILDRYIDKLSERIVFNNRLKEQENRQNERLDILQQRVVAIKEVLEKITNLGEGGDENVGELQNLIEKCREEKLVFNKTEFNRVLELMSQRLAISNQRIGIIIKKRLEGQIKRLNRLGSTFALALVEESIELMKKNNVDGMNQQIQKNEMWFKDRDNLLNLLAQMTERLRYCYEIEGINVGLGQKIKQTVENIDLIDIECCKKQYEEIFQNIEAINNEKSGVVIRHFIQEIIEKIKQTGIGNDYLFSALKSCMGIDDSFVLLKMLRPIMEEVEIVEILDKIKRSASCHLLLSEKLKKAEKKVIILNGGERNNIMMELRRISREITVLISEFHRIIPQNVSSFITTDLGIGKATQQSSILVLWLADKYIRGSYMNELLELEQQVGSRATDIKNRLKSEELKEILEKRQHEHVVFALIQNIII